MYSTTTTPTTPTTMTTPTTPTTPTTTATAIGGGGGGGDASTHHRHHCHPDWKECLGPLDATDLCVKVEVLCIERHIYCDAVFLHTGGLLLRDMALMQLKVASAMVASVSDDS